MTKPLAISAVQITAICKGAAKAGFIAEVVIDGVTVRLLPEHMAQPTEQKPKREQPKGYL